jgi:hypothetical protein
MAEHAFKLLLGLRRKPRARGQTGKHIGVRPPAPPTPTNPVVHPEAKALEATLGVYRFDQFECHELDIGAGAAALL